jgi:uncharacterized membrane protein
MKNFILFFSKTDLSVYRHCSQYAKNTQLSLGIFVILTGILAFFSGSYAISNLFVEFDWQSNTVHFNKLGYIFSPILGLFYAIMIIAIDREIVSAKDKKSVIIRIPLAIVIGLVVAVPIELEILKGRIEKQLIQEYRSENKGQYNIKQSSIASLNDKKSLLENDIKKSQVEINRWSEIMEQETAGKVRQGRTGVSGKGLAYEEAKRNMKLHIDNRKIAQNGLNNFLEYEYNQNLKQIDREYSVQQVSQQFDILSKYQALARMKEQDETGATKNIALGITILFILFETIPSLMKFLSPKTEYDAMLEARRLLNIQLTHSIANEGMEELNSGDLELTFDHIDKMGNKFPRSPLYHLNQIKSRIILDE